MELVLVGQPYSGKSTIFNEVVGYKSVSTNAPAASGHTHGQIQLKNERLDVIDLPGIYSLQASDETGDPTVDHILNAPPNTVLLNVIDASVLSRSLELTLQLMELRRPMVVALNMMDEAARKGIQIDSEKLSAKLGVPVVKTVGCKGEGVFELFHLARHATCPHPVAEVIRAPTHVERWVKKLTSLLQGRAVPKLFSREFLAIKLIERDPCVSRMLESHLGSAEWDRVETLLEDLEAATEERAEYVMSSARHNMAFNLFEEVAQVGAGKGNGVHRKVDAVLMHPVLGYVFLVAVLAGVFSLIFEVGNTMEPLFLQSFEAITSWLGERVSRDTLLFSVIDGFVTGFGGGIGIVIPYLLPFFIALAFLEETGYLPRIAYLIDNLMHKIGLHGMSVVPIIMGYGCSVPGVLATRILKSRRDKLITATLTTLIPCSARMTIIFGLIGFFISMKAAVLVYVFNLLIVGLVGRVMSTAMPEESPGMLMEIPRYHLPELETLAKKTWFRLGEFVVIAWPMLIAGSIILEIVEHFEWLMPINAVMKPYTANLLGFPATVGVTLLFGIMRKELALVLLFSVLGTTQVDAVMSTGQIFAYTFFVTFYVPCLATFAALANELSWRTASLITLATLVIVTLITVLLRYGVPLLS